MVTGNINSYARLCNEPDQLKQLQQYNELTASLSVLNAEKQEQAELAHKKKMKEGKDRGARKAEKARKAKEEEEQSLPTVKELLYHMVFHIVCLKCCQQRSRFSSIISNTPRQNRLSNFLVQIHYSLSALHLCMMNQACHPSHLSAVIH